MNKKLSLVLSVLIAGCASQPPAPVVEGYKKSPYQPQWEEEGEQNTPAKTVLQTGPSNGTTPFTEPQTYLVQPGDSLSQIARHFRVSTSSLAARNNLRENSILSVGQVLIVPVEGEKIAPNKTAATPRATPQQNSRFTDRVTKTPTTKNTQTPAPVVNKVQQKAVGTVHHRVKKGENLFRIGLKYDVSVLDLMNMNQLEKPEDLQAGTILKVPTLRQPAAKTVVQNTQAAQKQGLVWPVKGKVIKSFGQKSTGVNHTGINIAAKHGTPVVAAASGSVIYASGGLKSYGNLILLRHADGLITAYAHNAQNLINKNDYVQRGQIIAYVGQTGNVSTPQLHFEVRRNARALNPISVLPR